MYSKDKSIQLQRFILKNKIDLENARFALTKNEDWIYIENTKIEDSSICELNAYVLINRVPVKAGYATYNIGKGYWSDRQANLFKLEVFDNFRGSGIATYLLAYLTEIAHSQRANLIDGKFYPSNYDAEVVYNKNGFNIEKEYYDTRVVKYIYQDEIENIDNNSTKVDSIKIYNNHKTLYTQNYRIKNDSKEI